ncbi:hypothetical protein ASG25_12710 [Rhizobium sp. Leaf384]|uniref:DUF2778 domain-containing protein n=1 Tax=unclassified Rhizobium TaxID=2613769 RepID=UPI000714D00C|nr:MULTISPECIES: DUF2778 domain-containing protein [unclassified Rhizobium]KQS79390.1 hypothetical protein ASG25_12710 [Rhizobium sp. Leaf384]KQS85031.1 hypothetical protein ASG58_19400 [Rhizobium sp. Leaf383]
MALAIENVRQVDTRSQTRPRRQQSQSPHRPGLRTEKRAGWLPGLAIAGVGLAGAGWLMATLLTIHGVAGDLATGGRPAFQTSLGLNAIARGPVGERTVHVAKFSRLVKTPVVAVAVAKAPPPIASASAAHRIVLAALPPKPAAPVATAAAVQVASLDARAEVSVPLRENAMLEPDNQTTGSLPKPFSLVLNDDETTDRLPDLGPLPLSRPGVTIEADEAPAAAERPRKPSMQLAYAKPNAPIDLDDDEPSMAPSRPLFGSRKGVAYYDISAGVVHMPNGEKLEAHSGIGKLRDNPNAVHIPMKGPTPPGTYKVTMREALFHGVEAVRLTPIDGVAPHGRVGLLAHSYLLRNRGDSHGCVAFADYPRFLKAFKRGEITQMVIVKSMKGGFSKPAKTLASLFSRNG